MHLDLERLDQVHPVILKEISAAMQRIAESGIYAHMGKITQKSRDAASAPSKPTQAVDRLPETYVAESIASLPTEHQLAAAVKEATAETEPVVHILPTKEEVETRVAAMSPVTTAPYGHPTKEDDEEAHNAEQVVELLGEAETTEAAALHLMAGGTVEIIDGAIQQPVAPIAPAHTELDTSGLPWDERIHAGTRTHVKGGKWKFKPRITQELKDEVTAELRLTYPETVAAPVQTDPATGHVVPSAEEVFGDAAPAPVQNECSQAAAPEEYTFVSLLEEIIAVVDCGDQTQQTADLTVAAVCKEFGVTGLPDLQSRPDLVDPFRERLNGLLGPRVS